MTNYKERKESFKGMGPAGKVKMRNPKGAYSQGGPARINRPNTFTVDRYFIVSTDKLQRIIEVVPDLWGLTNMLRGQQFCQRTVDWLKLNEELFLVK